MAKHTVLGSISGDTLEILRQIRASDHSRDPLTITGVTRATFRVPSEKVSDLFEKLVAADWMKPTGKKARVGRDEAKAYALTPMGRIRIQAILDQ